MKTPGRIRVPAPMMDHAFDHRGRMDLALDHVSGQSGDKLLVGAEKIPRMTDQERRRRLKRIAGIRSVATPDKGLAAGIDHGVFVTG